LQEAKHTNDDPINISSLLGREKGFYILAMLVKERKWKLVCILAIHSIVEQFHVLGH
jgi:hypothetical protein